MENSIDNMVNGTFIVNNTFAVNDTFVVNNTFKKSARFKPDDELETIYIISNRQDILSWCNGSKSVLWWTQIEYNKMRTECFKEFNEYKKVHPNVKFPEAIRKMHEMHDMSLICELVSPVSVSDSVSESVSVSDSVSESVSVCTMKKSKTYKDLTLIFKMDSDTESDTETDTDTDSDTDTESDIESDTDTNNYQIINSEWNDELIF
jgi:hypothetical protein